MKTAGIFLVTVALIAGMAGCVGVEYDLTISSTDGGSVTAPGEGTFTYYEGTTADLLAEADEGYRFVNWTGDVETITDIHTASTNITMNADYSITASFEEIPEYSLTIASTAGGLVTSPGEGTSTYEEGTVVNLVATPDAGCLFAEWTGDVDTVGNVNSTSTTVTMSGNYSITAEFEQIPPEQFTLTISRTAGGLVTVPGEGTFVYDAGLLVGLAANPLGGYDFAGWSGDVSTIANVSDALTTITMNGDYSITANFEKTPVTYYTLTLAVKGSGINEPAGRTTHLCRRYSGLPHCYPSQLPPLRQLDW